MTTSSLLSRKVQLTFGSAIACLLALSAIAYRGMVVSGESDQWVRHTHAVLEQLHELQSAMLGIESSYRGFVLTGNESYVAAYRASIATATQDEGNIRDWTADNPAQQSRLPALEKLTAQKIQFGETVIGLRRTTGLEAAATAIQTGLGQQTMDDFQRVVGEMQDEELRLLVQRDADARRHVVQTKSILVFGTILGFLIVSAAGWSVQRDQSALGVAEEALREGEGRFRTLANSISQLAWMADEKGYIFWYNDRWFDYTGTTLARDGGMGLAKSASSRPRAAGGGQDHAVFPDRRGLGRHLSPSRPGWQLPLFPSREPFLSAMRRARYCAGSAPTPTSAKPRSRERSTAACSKRLPTPWSS